MARIRWSRRSLLDLEEIAEYISVDSVKYAKLTIQRIKARVAPLRLQPYLGRVVPEQNEEVIREVFSGQYRILYEVIDYGVLILAVRHMARSLQPEVFRRFSE